MPALMMVMAALCAVAAWYPAVGLGQPHSRSRARIAAVMVRLRRLVLDQPAINLI